MTVSPFAAGLQCKCPRCGNGDLFQGYLTFRSECEACGTNFDKADVGDGASFFVMFLTMALVVPTALIMEILFRPPMWVLVAGLVVFTLVFSIGLLRPAKSLLFALQWSNDAAEAKLDEDTSHP